MTASDTVTACVVVIGNEVLSGRTRDANLQFLAAGLGEIGVRVAEARVIPDDRAVIVATVNACRARFDYVFTTGGIGPTHDDITAACIAEAFGVPLERNAEAVAMLRSHYENPADLNEARLKMADIPAGAVLIENPVSKAPGFQLGNVFVLAGIPRIVEAMFGSLKHRLSGGAPLLSRTISAHLVEGALAPGLSALQDRFADVEVGSYPYFHSGQLGVSVVLRSTEAARLDAAAGALEELIRGLGGEPIEGGRNGGGDGGGSSAPA
jgi:molybdenum cofactor synthesis domain-containing protein